MSLIVFGEVVLPDGRKLSGQITGYNDNDTNAFIETSLTLEWADGRELTADEENERIEGCYLHEWVADWLHEHGTWEDYQDEPEEY